MNPKYIVIGAGILGASTAYFLAKQGAEVVIVDRKDEGQATDAAAGIVSPWLSKRRNKAWYKLAKGGARMYPDLIEELHQDGETETGYSRIGALNLHTDESKLTDMRDWAIKRREDAPEIGELTLLDENQTNVMFPLLSSEYRALHVSGAARVDGRALRNALISGAKKHGASFRTGDAALTFQGSQITGVTINDTEQIQADTVIAATGVWMDKLFEPLNISFKVNSQKAQILHVEVPEMDTSKWPLIKPPSRQYMLAFENGRIIIGTTHEDHAGDDLRVTAGGLHEILSNAMHIAPGLADSTVLETRVGFRPFTPESMPVIGALPGYNGLLLANGLGSSGLTTGPYIGQQIANLAMGLETEIDIADYDVGRAIK